MQKGGKRPGIKGLRARVVLTFLGAVLFQACTQPVQGPPEARIEWLPEEERRPVDLSGTFLRPDGQETALVGNAHGEAVFLNLWATWCGPCLEEMPSMAALHEKLAGKGLRMVAVSDEDPETVRLFLEDYPYPFEVLLDPESLLMQRFEVIGIPTTLIIDPQGRLALLHTGASHWDTPGVVEQFDLLLAGP